MESIFMLSRKDLQSLPGRSLAQLLTRSGLLSMTISAVISMTTSATAAPPAQQTKTTATARAGDLTNRTELLKKAWSDYGQGKSALAIQEYDRIIKLIPVERGARSMYAVAFLGRAQVRESQEQFAKAAEDALAYVALAPSARWSSASACRILAEASLYKDAVSQLNKYIFSTSNHAGPYALLSVCSALLHENKACLPSLNHALKYNFGPHDMNIVNGPFCSEKTFSLVRKRCEAQIKRKPKDAQAHFALGVIDTLLKSYPPAIHELTLSLSLDPRLKEAFTVRANCYISTGDRKAALQDINRAIDLDPVDPSNYATLERYYNLSANFDQIFGDLDRRISKNPHNAVLLIAKAIAHEKLAEPSKAIDSYSSACLIDPKCAEAFNNRGRLQQELSKYDHAIRDFSAAIKLEPTNPYPYRDRASCYAAIHKDKETIADISRVIDLTQDPYAYAVRAECYNRMGKPDLAGHDRQIAEQNRPQF
jgi:tetratricopeptide (TPR) repeat protein